MSLDDHIVWGSMHTVNASVIEFEDYDDNVVMSLCYKHCQIWLQLVINNQRPRSFYDLGDGLPPSVRA